SGCASIPVVALSALGYGVAAIGVTVGYTLRLRDLVGALAAAALALGLAAPRPAAAQVVPDADAIAKLEQLNGIHVEAHPLADGLAREGRFTAVSVWLENRGEATVGTLSLSERAADGTSSVTYQRDVELPQGGRKQVQLLLQPGIGRETRVLNLLTRDRRIGVAPFPLTALEPSAAAIAVVGPDLHGLAAKVRDATLQEIPRRRYGGVADGDRQVRVGTVPEVDLPLVSAGYQAIDWVVWPAADPSGVRPEQLEALRHWVADGGHLLLWVSDTWRQLGDSALGPALPVALDGVRDERIDELARVFGRTADDERPVVSASMRPVRGAVVRARTGSGAPLWVSAPYGLGSVHVVLTDADASPLDLRQSEQGWRALLTLAPPGASAADQLAAEPIGYAGEVTEMLHLDPPAVAADVVVPDVDPQFLARQALSDIPGVAPLPMSWLVAFSAVYLLAIGPLDYLGLRLIRRQPWTWVTFRCSSRCSAARAWR
ncbi:MAG: hypothetical protein R3F59_37600, partial [Myxococcota bacterium]